MPKKEGGGSGNTIAASLSSGQLLAQHLLVTHTTTMQQAEHTQSQQTQPSTAMKNVKSGSCNSRNSGSGYTSSPGTNTMIMSYLANILATAGSGREEEATEAEVVWYFMDSFRRHVVSIMDVDCASVGSNNVAPIADDSTNSAAANSSSKCKNIHNNNDDVIASCCCLLDWLEQVMAYVSFETLNKSIAIATTGALPIDAKQERSMDIYVAVGQDDAIVDDGTEGAVVPGSHRIKRQRKTGIRIRSGGEQGRKGGIELQQMQRVLQQCKTACQHSLWLPGNNNNESTATARDWHTLDQQQRTATNMKVSSIARQQQFTTCRKFISSLFQCILFNPWTSPIGHSSPREQRRFSKVKDEQFNRTSFALLLSTKAAGMVSLLLSNSSSSPAASSLVSTVENALLSSNEKGIKRKSKSDRQKEKSSDILNAHANNRVATIVHDDDAVQFNEEYTCNLLSMWQLSAQAFFSGKLPQPIRRCLALKIHEDGHEIGHEDEIYNKKGDSLLSTEASKIKSTTIKNLFYYMHQRKRDTLLLWMTQTLRLLGNLLYCSILTTTKSDQMNGSGSKENKEKDDIVVAMDCTNENISKIRKSNGRQSHYTKASRRGLLAAILDVLEWIILPVIWNSNSNQADNSSDFIHHIMLATSCVEQLHSLVRLSSSCPKESEFLLLLRAKMPNADETNSQQQATGSAIGVAIKLLHVCTTVLAEREEEDYRISVVIGLRDVLVRFLHAVFLAVQEQRKIQSQNMAEARSSLETGEMDVQAPVSFATLVLEEYPDLYLSAASSMLIARPASPVANDSAPAKDNSGEGGTQRLSGSGSRFCGKVNPDIAAQVRLQMEEIYDHEEQEGIR